jgi:hypothetical protein
MRYITAKQQEIKRDKSNRKKKQRTRVQTVKNLKQKKKKL